MIVHISSELAACPSYIWVLVIGVDLEIRVIRLLEKLNEFIENWIIIDLFGIKTQSNRLIRIDVKSELFGIIADPINFKDDVIETRLEDKLSGWAISFINGLLDNFLEMVKFLIDFDKDKASHWVAVIFGEMMMILLIQIQVACRYIFNFQKKPFYFT